VKIPRGRILSGMVDGNEAQQLLDFALLHKVFIAPAVGSIAGFGFAAGRYFFSKQLAILKQENELLEERVKKALAELDEKTRALLARGDPVQAPRIEERKMASNRQHLDFSVPPQILLRSYSWRAVCTCWPNSPQSRTNNWCRNRKRKKKCVRRFRQFES
jgi:hypothetical protein